MRLTEGDQEHIEIRLQKWIDLWVREGQFP